MLNLIAPVNSLGYGVVGKNIVLELMRQGQEVALWPIGPVDVQPDEVAAIQSCLTNRQRYDPAEPSIRIWHQFDLALHVGKSFHVAMPIFELDRFRPDEIHHLRCQDLVLATCKWARTILEQVLPASRIAVVPLGVNHEVFFPRVTPEQEQPTTFLCIGKWEMRKGHDIIRQAFEQAFRPGDAVRLIMHCHNPCFADASAGRAYNEQWKRYYQSSSMAAHISLSEGRLATQEEVAGLMSQADCGLFVSRGEGWNLEAAEMLAMGKHIIATNYSGHTEFCNRFNSRLVGVGPLEEAHDGVWFNADNPAWNGHPGRWASLGASQVDQIAAHLRDIHTLKQSGRLERNQAGIDTMAQLSWSNTVSRLLQAIQEKR